MKIILSRKGFDSSAGGCPNPIFPNGSMLALPIPDGQSKIAYKEVTFQDIEGQQFNVGTLVKHLTKDRVKPHHKAHLDPDLIASQFPRDPLWKPLLGQSGSAQGHLNNQGVDVGDLFVYFAVFRDVEKVQRKWRFVPGAPNRHIIWATMKVQDVIKVDEARLQDPYAWLNYHPHWQYGQDQHNAFYVGDQSTCRVFSKFDPLLQLTDPSSSKPSLWKLPRWWYPKSKSGNNLLKTPLSYHHNLERWSKTQNHCMLQAVARGQEFVLNADDYPEAEIWLRQLHDLSV